MAKKARQYAEEDETAIQETKTRRACQDKERRDLCQKRTLELAELEVSDSYILFGWPGDVPEFRKVLIRAIKM